MAKFGPSPFPIGLHYLSQNKDLSQPSTHTLNKFYAIWYLSKLIVLRDGEMDDLKTLNVLSVPILAALGSAPCQPLEGGFTHSESESLGGGGRKETRKKYDSTIPCTWGELSTT